ncbi:MAG: hypothetical protein KKB20_06025 [Proteobacteria bacterium]|nr:hypothetical protein [Pseudomonadota bacterium]
MDRSEDPCLEAPLVVSRPGRTPPCLEAGHILCRGCSGWLFMRRALARPDSSWRTWPIHCQATGLTVRRSD